MRILVVSATTAEIQPLAAAARSHEDHHVDVLVTGVGMLATAVRTTRALLQSRYDFAVNLGLCGSFDPALPRGTVVHVVSDQMPELGAEDESSFLTIQELGLLSPDEPPFVDGCLVNTAPPQNAVLDDLPAVRGVTVNTAHGDAASIAALLARLRPAPQVESMEGAAFMYACLVHGIPFAQVRAVSNVVEHRNRVAWQIPEALSALQRVAMDLLASL